MTTTQNTPSYALYAKPEAIACAAMLVDREWGYTGYTIEAVHGGPLCGSCVMRVAHSDGSRFYVGSDRWGNTDHSDHLDDLYDLMVARKES